MTLNGREKTKYTEEVLLFVVGVHFLVLVRNTLLLENNPTPLNIRAELSDVSLKVLGKVAPMNIPIQPRKLGPGARYAVQRSSPRFQWHGGKCERLGLETL